MDDTLQKGSHYRDRNSSLAEGKDKLVQFCSGIPFLI